MKLMQDVNHSLAAYRQLLLLIGSPATDTKQLRADLIATRHSCLKSCDTAKNYVLPQLRNENLESQASTDFTNQATQFIGVVNAFIAEMKRSLSLLESFPNGPPGSSSSAMEPCTGAQSASHISASPGAPNPSDGDGNGCGELSPSPAQPLLSVASTPEPAAQPSSSTGPTLNGPKSPDYQETVKDLIHDIQEAEAMLALLENAITVHFSTGVADPVDANKLPTPRSRKKKRCQFCGFCSNFKTTYA